MKNLQQAIDHARQVYESYRNTVPDCDCAMEHLQLAKWLEELQSARKTLGLLRSALDETSACADCTPNDRINRQKTIKERICTMRNEQECNEKKWLTPREAAAFLAVNPETLRRYRQRGILKAVVISKRKIMFQRAELERFLTAHVEG